MSKSLGNVIDPLEVINRVGADALRFALISLITGQGQDIKLSEEKIVEARNFANKIWNASRFVVMTKAQLPISEFQIPKDLELVDRWILSRFNQTIKKVTESIESYEFGEAARALYEFIWSEFCDWYVEIAKIRLYGQDIKAKMLAQGILLTILEGILKMLHPFMPFITEEIYQRVIGQEARDKKTIMLESWAKADKSLIDNKTEEEMGYLIEIIRQIRNLRREKNIPPKDEIEIKIYSLKEERRELLAKGKAYLLRLAKVRSFSFEKISQPELGTEDRVEIS